MAAAADDRVTAFASVAGLLGGALLLVSRDGRIHWCNDPLLQLLSLQASAVVGRRLHELAADDPPQVDALLRSASRSPVFLPAGLHLRNGAGQPIACRCDGALYQRPGQDEPPLLALRIAAKAQGSPEFIALREKIRQLSTEIGLRKQAEEAARRWGARYRVTLESIGDAVIATDAAGSITFMNAVAERLTGWTAQEASGRHLDQVFVILNESTGDPVESPVAKVLRQGQVVGLANHTLLVRRDGSRLPIDDSGAPIRSAGGTIDGVVLVFRDLSERHALERELLAKTARLEDADRRKDEYLSMLAHELRNPLAPIRSGIEVLRRRPPEATAARTLEMMGRQVSHIVRLVDDLLDVSRITRGKFELRTDDIPLARLLSEAEEMSRPLFEQAGVALDVAPDTPPVVLHGDRVRLVQLLGNLLSNAAKFSSPGQTVRLRAHATAAAVEITVQDEGIGIPADQLPRVFDLFYQADQGPARERGGLGVGLTIASSIAQMHGGVLKAHSNGPGRGTTFTVSLPLVAPQGRRGPG